MRSYIAVLLVVLFMSGCATKQLELKPRINTEIGFDFTSLSKFYVAYKKSAQPAEFSDKNIAQLLSKYFEKKGYVVSDNKEKSDFYFVIHHGIKCDRQREKDYESMDVYPRFKNDLKPIVINGKALYSENPYVEPVGKVSADVNMTEVHRYKNKMMLIEILDTKSNKIVWQGFIENKLPTFETKEEKENYMNEVLERLFKDFPDHK